MKMIEPGGIFQFTGNLEQLEKDVSALRSNAIGIRNGGLHVHSRFQMLEAHYKAPEADQLLSSTLPVSQKADAFATDLEAVADALDTYAHEVRPLVKRLEQLKADALAFVDSVEGKDDWTEDEGKVDRHQKLLDGVNTAVAAFQEAERRAAGKISALVGGPKLVVDDGSHTQNRKEVMYGYGLNVLGQAKELPWGSPVTEARHWWDWDFWEHQAKSFVWDGLVMDNIVGSVDGLITLFSPGEEGSQARQGLGRIAVGLGAYMADIHPDGPQGAWKSEFYQGSKKYTKEFAKSLVAWDMWDENPSRASATVAFNALTLAAGPLVATATKGAKAGTAAKAAIVAARVGEYIDPLSATFKATGKVAGSLPKISEVTGRIRAGLEAAHSQRLHSELELADGSKVRIQDGEFLRVDADGNSIRDTPKRELGAHERDGQHERTAERQLAGVSTDSRKAEPFAQRVENRRPSTSHEVPTSRGGGGDGTPSSNGEERVGRQPAEQGSSHDPVSDKGRTDHGPARGTGADPMAEGSGDRSHGGSDDPPSEVPGEGSAPGAPESAPDDVRADEWLTGARRRPRDLLDDPTQTRWAQKAYDDFLASERDIGEISKATVEFERIDGSRGFSPDEISLIKKHIFDTEHPIVDYDTGEVIRRKFDADAEIADAWIRLRAGRPEPTDFILLGHEMTELTYLRDNPGVTYQEAHRHANRLYNWSDAPGIPLGRREDFEGEW
ncbi:hypothetical protein ACFYYR_27595 [Streptomyces sp. NPDC001922]|uniref:hypothetical protein n=1 Tax=Streptomyces sp. NPDC001922 TaxID=3364624 RepID=UPI0036C669FA